MKYRQFVLVEGKDDEHVIKHLCGARMIPPVLKFEPFENVDELISAIPTRLKASLDGDVVAIVLDADDSLVRRWASIRDHLLGLRYQTVTDEPNASGTIIEPPSDALLPRLGIWIMPNNRLNGMLEDFLALLVLKQVIPDGHFCEIFLISQRAAANNAGESLEVRRVENSASR